jgi:hypothetical protein
LDAIRKSGIAVRVKVMGRVNGAFPEPLAGEPFDLALCSLSASSVLPIKIKVKITSGTRIEQLVNRFLILKGCERCGAETAMYLRLNSW